MTDEFKTYEEATGWLFNDLPTSEVEIFRGQESLDQASLLFGALGNPQNNYRTIHIAGTSGKGSTAQFALDLLKSNSRRVGAIMSPHVYDLRERFTVNDKLPSQSETLVALRRLKQAVDGLSTQGVFPTYFQCVAALGYIVFERHKLDYLVVETGLGGRYDSTNLITRNDKVVILNVTGLDHTEVLGNDLVSIAQQEAGIITPNSTVIALSQSLQINAVFRAIAKHSGAKLTFVKPAADYQQNNYRLSRRACQLIARRDAGNWKFKNAVTALEDFRLPGRFEARNYKKRLVLLDGAHNLQKLESLVGRLVKVYPAKKFVVVLAMGKSKDPSAFVALLKPVAKEFVFTRYSAFTNSSQTTALDFTGVKIDAGVEFRVENDTGALVRKMTLVPDDYLITGSFYLVGEIGSLLP